MEFFEKVDREAKLIDASEDEVLAQCGNDVRAARRLRFDLYRDRLPVNTANLVDGVAWALSRFAREVRGYEGNLSAWEEDYRKVEAGVAELLGGRFGACLPLRGEVLPYIVAALYGRMPFERNYVLRKYERKHRGKDFLFYPGRNASRLIVLFAGNVGRKTYSRYSWFWDESENWERDAAYLFLNDIDSHWYVGRSDEDDGEVYKDIIREVMREVGVAAHQAVAVGGSMGGYGALRYGVELGFSGVVAINPQLCFESALRYKEPSWELKIRECGKNFVSISDAILRAGSSPFIALEHSLAPCDVAGLDDLVHASRHVGGRLLLHSTGKLEHQADGPPRSRLVELIDFLGSRHE